MQLRSAIAFQLMITLEKQMSKLMSSLVAATIVGAFSMSAIAADAAKAAPAAAATPAAAAAPAAVAATAEKPAVQAIRASR